MNLYRRKTLEASFLLVLAGAIGFTAATAQRRKPHKLRATAVVELTTSPAGTTTARLIPITILDDGTFHDAGIYKNTPQPMALSVGVVYEAQKTGQVAGYVTVGNAKKEVNGNWSAAGRWQPAISKPNAPNVQASASELNGPRSNDSGYVEARPILHRPGSSSSPTPAASPTPSTTSTPASTPTPSDDRPTLHRTPADVPVNAPTPTASSTPAVDTEDPDRPTLRRRTPPSVKQEASGQPTPPPAAGQTAAASAPTPKPALAPPVLAPGDQTLVAVSDDQASESRSYEFVWKAGEQEAIQTKMRHLALDQLPHDSSGAAVKDSALTKVVLRGFDLDLSNDAVMVLTAELPPGGLATAKPAAKSGSRSAAGTKSQPPAAASGPAPTSQVTRYITVIARLDLDGNPQKLAASVTDSSRLDVVPRLELIDAVDVDGDGLAELLFRQYSVDEKSFVIFAIGRSTVTKLFEGASQPLK